MITNDWLKQAMERLEAAGIGTARLDCLVLLQDILDKDKSFILAHPETNLADSQVDELNVKVGQRATHIPLAFVRGKTEFYGREFLITKDVLEPRPESETMIELLLDLVESKKLKAENIVDVGTGSGALAITAKLGIPGAEVFAIDIDPACVEVAKKNSNKHNTDITFYEGNLLKPLLALGFQLSAVLANLPYVPDDFTINEAAMWEPKLAIFGGKDGLDLYRDLFSQITSSKSKVESPKFILTESLPFQHEALAEIAKEAGYKQIKEDDFIQLFELS